MDIKTVIKDIFEGKVTLQVALESAIEFGEKSATPKIASKVQIVIAPRGWIFVGYTHEDKEGRKLIIEKCNVIRTWGTTKGIGELTNGPLSSTKLDKCSTTRIPLDAVITQIDCEDLKWQTHL